MRHTATLALVTALMLSIISGPHALSRNVIHCADTGRIYSSQYGQCYEPTRQGPCKSGQWFILTSGSVEGSCVKRPCPFRMSSLQVLHQEKCVSVSNLNMCKSKGEVLFPNLYGEGICDCDDGFYRHSDNRCYQEFTKGWCPEGKILRKLADLTNHRKCRTTDSSNHEGKRNATCVFPFRYKGNTYDGCTDIGVEDAVFSHWCSTKVDERGAHVGEQEEWGYCNANCPKTGYPTNAFCGIIFENNIEHLLLIDIIAQKVRDKMVCAENPCGNPNESLMWYDGECHDVGENLDDCEMRLNLDESEDYYEENGNFNKLVCFNKFESFSVGPAFNSNINKKPCPVGRIWNKRRGRCVRSYRG